MADVQLENEKLGFNEDEEVYVFENFEDFEKVLTLIDEFERAGEFSDRDLTSSFLAISNPRIFEQKLTLKKAKQSNWANYGNYYINFKPNR